MRHIIGIDLGGTKIEGVLINEEGKILDKVRVQTQAIKGKETVIENIISVAKKLWADPVFGIGIGVPGPVKEDGVVSYMPNIKQFRNVNLQSILSKKLGVEVKIENDANLFALAEHTFGAGKKNPNMMGITLGTGIGSGIIINNILFSGRYGGAGEIGHNIVDHKKMRDLEYFCSGPGIVRLYKNAGGKGKLEEPIDIFKSKDVVAKAVVEKIHELLSHELANVVNTLNIELFVLGGGVTNSLDIRKLYKLTKKFVFHPLQDTFKIIKYKIGDSAGSLGAAALFFDR